VVDSATRLPAAPKLALPPATTVEWRATSPEIARWKPSLNHATDAAKRATSHESAPTPVMLEAAVSALALERSAISADKWVILLVVVRPVAADIVAAVVEVLAEVPLALKLVTIAVVLAILAGTVLVGSSLTWVAAAAAARRSASTVVTLVTSAVNAVNHNARHATAVAKRGISRAIAPTLPPRLLLECSLSDLSDGLFVYLSASKVCCRVFTIDQSTSFKTTT